MKELGAFVMLVGAGVVFYGLFGYDPSVTLDPGYAIGTHLGDVQTVNFARLAIQVGVIMSGGFMSLIGSILFAAQCVIDALSPASVDTTSAKDGAF